jgi:hypothetical protein
MAGGGTPVGTGTSCTLTPTSSGTLSVVANNSCGSSTASTLEHNCKHMFHHNPDQYPEIQHPVQEHRKLTMSHPYQEQHHIPGPIQAEEHRLEQEQVAR